MQDIKESSTLRISAEGKKLFPKVVFRDGLQDKQIKNFLETRKLILTFLRDPRMTVSRALRIGNMHQP
jgi:hypothetical protein